MAMAPSLSSYLAARRLIRSVGCAVTRECAHCPACNDVMPVVRARYRHGQCRGERVTCANCQRELEASWD